VKWLYDLFSREPIYGPTIGLVALFVMAYCGRCWKDKRDFELQSFVAGVLSCSGLVGGSLMVASTVLPELQSKISDAKLYTLLGGGCVLWVSYHGLRQVFRHQG
jgi:hypothetical protein